MAPFFVLIPDHFNCMTLIPWIFFFTRNSECFTTYSHEYFFCEALNSARHRFGPSVIFQGCCKNLGRCNPLLDKTAQQRKQMRTIKYWRWQYSAGCNYLNNNILLLVRCSSKPGREWSNTESRVLTFSVSLKTCLSSDTVSVWERWSCCQIWMIWSFFELVSGGGKYTWHIFIINGQ